MQSEAKPIVLHEPVPANPSPRLTREDRERIYNAIDTDRTALIAVIEDIITDRMLAQIRADGERTNAVIERTFAKYRQPIPEKNGTNLKAGLESRIEPDHKAEFLADFESKCRGEVLE